MKYKSRLVCAVIGLFFLPSIFLQSNSFGQTKAVKGTWINLPYQDVRNKYMNPAHVNYTSAEFWKEKITEQNDLGIEYLIIMAVANEQKSFYPSSFMSPAYPVEEKSPVEAIMETADKLKMKVFMSCGWAINQDDNIRDPKIKAIQEKIMEETALLFKNHPSFFGWYLPVEDSFDPYPSDHSIESVNALTKRAKSLTPDKKVMISPYGLVYADVDSKRFADQIKKFKVDIIAYQDEVGCVREPMPLKRMKEHFATLGKIHKETNIAFWANVESFTWEKKDNDRASALIPAAFPRYLSQMAGVTQAGVEEVVSFATYGIYDKPASTMPIGQPCFSAKAYQDFLDWKDGKGRWPFLEATFKGNISHEAVGKKVISKVSEVNKLTDNQLGQETTEDSSWVDFGTKKMEIIIDMGKQTSIKDLSARFLQFKKENIAIPPTIHFYASNKKNKGFKRIGSVVMDISPNDRHDCWIDIALLKDLNEKAHYIKIESDSRNGGRILSDEVMVNLNLN